MEVGRCLLVSACVATVGLLTPAHAAPPAPEPPTGLTVAATTGRSVTLDWADQADVAAYRVQISAADSMAGARLKRVHESTVRLRRLEPDHDYFVRVRAVRAHDRARSAWSAVLGVRTAPPKPAPAPAPPPPPPTVAVTAKTYRSADLDWPDLPGAATYRVELSRSESMEGATTTAVQPSTAQIFGLTPASDYYVRARGVDAAGAEVGEWTSVTRLHTKPAPPAPTQPVLTVASFNVRCALCHTGYNDEEPWAERRDTVVGQVIERRPDVIGFQEASQGRLPGTDTPQFVDLRTRLRDAGVPYEITNAYRYNCERSETPISCEPRDREASQGTRIFYNTETVELVEQGSKLLPSCDDDCNNRYVAWAILKQKATGKSFFLANVHTQYMAKYADLRTEEVQVMMDEIEDRNEDKLPAFVVGDFNSTRYQSPTNAPYDEVIAAGFVDPLGHTPQSAAVSALGSAETRIRANYNSHNNFLRTVAPFAEWENGSNIDYIFSTPMRIAQWETVVNVDADNEIVGTIPSDHNMIQVKAVLP